MNSRTELRAFFGGETKDRERAGRRPQILRLGVALALTLANVASAQTYTVLKSFTGSDGQWPHAGLVLSGSTLYGTTEFGGSSSNGVVFKVNTDGSGYAVLKNFTNRGDGAQPYAGLALAGSTLYGTTCFGGSSDDGVIFKMNTDGSGYTVLKNFTGSDGALPKAALVLSGGTLYGTTCNGGWSGQGVVFRLNTDGSDYTVLKSFAMSFAPSNGEELPSAGLILSGSTLYGTTEFGGSPGDGVVFKVNTDGSGYTVLKSFNGTDGRYLYAGLVLAGSTLYGTTAGGGSSACGVIFKVNTDDSGFAVLKNFTGSDGANPQASLILAGSTLYGTTWGGGSSADGVVFKLNTDGSGYAVLKSFTGSDGGRPGALVPDAPRGGLVLAGSAVYGTTAGGGDFGCGVIFSLDWGPNPPPIIVAPQSQTIEAGGSVAFRIEVANLGPVAYQWIFNGTNALDGATNSVLQLANLQLAQAGAYAVVVTNSYGAVTSAPAILDVIPLGTTPVASCTQGALRAALAGPGPVTFACDGTITLTDTIEIGTNTVLDGTDHQVTISGGNLVQVFWVNSDATLSAINLTIANGLSTDGGGIYNADGTVNLTNCTFFGNRACGPDGIAWGAAADGAGGAIYNAGTLTASRCTFLDNSASGGSWPADVVYNGPLGPGADGQGGAIYNSGSFNASFCAFLRNSASGGQAGKGGLFMNDVAVVCGMPGYSGGQACGGAVCNFGMLTIDRSLLASNTAAGGNGGPGGDGWDCFSGDAGGSGGDGGAGGDGCGAALFGGPATLLNCTLAGNLCLGGGGGPGGQGGYGEDHGYYWPRVNGAPGPAGAGSGAIFTAGGALHLTNCTLALNSGALCGGLSGSGATLVNTLLAANVSSNASGTITDGGHNLSSDSSCAFANVGSLNNTDPRLGPLANNGGPTLTIALLPGSPAIDAADTAAAPATDQRGFPRPVGSAADIGAYEFGWPAPGVLQATRPPGGGIDISVSGGPGQTCRFFASPDLVNWAAIATNHFRADGTLLFHDAGGAGQPRRFYRVAMP
ncbi:MAG: choice-of-anchor tandem repeat GloVer-containing protein [Verrucomicrobiota bacterium]